jgi:hypothetical protein
VVSCSGEDGAVAKKDIGVRIGTGYSYSRTDLKWKSAVPEAAIDRHAIVVTGELRVSNRVSVQIGSGAAPGGSIAVDGTTHTIGPGWLAFGAVTYRILDGQGRAPFLLASLSFATSSARTVDDRDPTIASHIYTFDARGGLTIGKTLWNVLSPYAAGRVFGGPVRWNLHGQEQTGSDKYHYQPAVGAVLALGRADVYAEWAFAGERALGAGVGASF